VRRDQDDLSRRAFLTGLAGAGAAGFLAACGRSAGSVAKGHARSGANLTPAQRRRRRPAAPRPPQSANAAEGSSFEVELATAAWLQAENAKPGTTNWVATGRPVPHAIEGYADRVSATTGDTVRLFVNTASPTFHVEAYRMGWYQGLGGRLVWQSAEVAGRRQPAPIFTPGINLIECAWAPTLAFGIDPTWPSGNYLLKLVGSDGQQQFVPLTVRDDTSTAAYVIQNSVTTWQAYNLWHRYSLYFGPHGAGQTYANRSRIVSFDRPYALAQADWANGASDWLGNEFPFVMLAERLGLDVTYWTDIDFANRPDRLRQHKALISLGHDEYWSTPMFDGALAARDAGVNFAFLGANACFRHIRLDASPTTGAARRVVCYKDAVEDPFYGRDNAEVTADWPDGPVPRPESALIGNMYQSNPVDAAMVFPDVAGWALAGAGLENGAALAGVVGTEYDAFEPGLSPPNAEIWAHSPLECRGQPGHSDVTWYTQPGGGGVFATGTNWWVSKLSDNPGRFPPALVRRATPGVTGPLTTVTKNVLAVLGTGPGGLLSPSVPNWRRFYPGGGPAGTPGGIRGA
jgi:hypothetical protein